jgi:hypothetical protein
MVNEGRHPKTFTIPAFPVRLPRDSEACANTRAERLPGRQFGRPGDLQDSHISRRPRSLADRPSDRNAQHVPTASRLSVLLASGLGLPPMTLELIDRDKALSVVIELAPGVAGNEQMAWTIANAIRQELLRLNSEFANYVPAQHQMPQVTLALAGDPEYLPVGVKHRYTRK